MYEFVTIWLIFSIEASFFSRKKVLYVHVESNARNSKLTVKSLKGFLGIWNVAFMNFSNNFELQDLIGKKVDIFDWFKYEFKHAWEYLKLFSGAMVISVQKHKHEYQFVEYLLIIVSNKIINLKGEFLKKVIGSRIFE